MPTSGRRAHEPAELTVTVRRLDDGSLQFTTATCPGWAFVARQPQQIGEALARAWTEAAVAAYAKLHGVLYDLAETEDDAAPPTTRRHPAEPEPPREDEIGKRRRRKHPRTHPPEEWQELDSGYFRSPTGRTYGPQTAIVASVRARLRR